VGEVAFSLERGDAIGEPVSSPEPVVDVTADLDGARREIAQNEATVGNIEDQSRKARHRLRRATPAAVPAPAHRGDLIGGRVQP
jgi:hypothetical protein